MSDELELMGIRIQGVKEAIGMVDYHFGHLTNRTLAAEALAASRLEMLRRAYDWFRANYSYLYMDKEVMDLWDDIEDELDKELGDE